MNNKEIIFFLKKYGKGIFYRKQLLASCYHQKLFPQVRKSMSDPERLSASLEDYLETIFHVVAEKNAARAKDIAKRLQVNNSSVTGALRVLSEKGYINYAPYDLITLTAKGNELARDVVRRHEALKDFFTKILQVEEDEAEDAACKMEHVISTNILDKLIRFVEFMDFCPKGGEDWLQAFEQKSCDPMDNNACEACLANCLNELSGKKDFVRNTVKPVVPLARLEIGEKGLLQNFEEKALFTRYFKDIQAKLGNIVVLEEINPENNTLTIKIKGYHLTLRKEDAEKIIVNPI